MRMTQKSVPFGIRRGQAVLILAITVQRRDVRRPVLNPLHKQKNAQREIPCAFVVKEVMMLLWKELFCTRNAFKLCVVCCVLCVVCCVLCVVCSAAYDDTVIGRFDCEREER